MRPLELLLLAGLILALIATLIPSYRNWRGRYVCLAIVFGVSIAHLAIEYYRWQLVPAYCMLALLLILHLRILYPQTHGSQPEKSKAIKILLTLGRWSLVALVFVGVIVSYLFGSLLPASKLPAPQGEFAVGHTRFEWTDNKRPEIYTTDPNDHRRLIVRVWYPISPNTVADKNPIPYWTSANQRSESLTSLLERRAGLPIPDNLFGYFGLVETNAYENIEIVATQGVFPVVLFSHGFFSYAGQNTILMEKLASQGYVVFAINHAFWGLLSEFSDGSVGLSEQVLSDYRNRDVELVQNIPDLNLIDRKIRDGDLGKNTQSALQEYLQLSPTRTDFYQEAYSFWSADQLFVLNKIETLNRGDSQFANRLDLNKVGIIGMSMGGPSSLLTCSLDKRCRAGVDLDGFNQFSVNIEPITVPYLYLRSDETRLSMANHKNFVGFKHRNTAYVLDVPNAQHADYMDFPYLAPVLSFVGQLGTVPPKKMLGLTNDYVLAFFDQHLKSGLTAPIKEIDRYKDEVTFYVKE